MITLPGWASLANLKLVGATIAGALMCAPLTYCAGKHDAEALDRANLIATAEKVRSAAFKVELSANVIDHARRAKSAAEIAALQEIVNEAGTNDAVGDGMQSLLERLRRGAPVIRDAAP
ncbi:MAG TPA: hypothetical protein VF503_20560 [Sphingobium sp.]|uniref:hypothetical protein n=1 Tax=Sphingobium sp. TaxID=1912891 RepID=UPI002ED60D47